MSDELLSPEELWDAQYFGLILELEKKNTSKYESFADQLLKKNEIIIEVEGTEIKFKLTPIGCRYTLINSKDGTGMESWTRMGWGKAAKRKALPRFFAKAEADLLIEL